MKKLNNQKHTLNGRRFETSMLCYDINNCDCCGKMFINHDDNLLEKINVIKRSHLTRNKYNAWKYCYMKTCSG